MPVCYTAIAAVKQCVAQDADAIPRLFLGPAMHNPKWCRLPRFADKAANLQLTTRKSCITTLQPRRPTGGRLIKTRMVAAERGEIDGDVRGAPLFPAGNASFKNSTTPQARTDPASCGPSPNDYEKPLASSAASGASGCAAIPASAPRVIGL